MRPDLSLVDQRALGLVDELDGVFHGDDVAVACTVDVVHKGGERGRLTAACGSGDEHETRGQGAQIAERLGEAERVHGGHFCRDGAHDDPGRAGVEHVATEPGPRGLPGEVGVVVLAELLPREIGCDLAHDHLDGTSEVSVGAPFKGVSAPSTRTRGACAAECGGHSRLPGAWRRGNARCGPSRPVPVAFACAGGPWAQRWGQEER